MNEVFLDTFFYLALLNPADSSHEAAVHLSRQLRARTVTTSWIITEVADALSAPPVRPVFVSLLEQLRQDRNLLVVPPTQQLLDRGLDLFAARPDKHWSLTDCISFVVMTDRSIAEALTGDHHFEQAGFRRLLP